MKSYLSGAVVVVAIMLGAQVLPVHAQTDDRAALQSTIENLRAQIASLQARLAQQQARLQGLRGNDAPSSSSGSGWPSSSPTYTNQTGGASPVTASQATEAVTIAGNVYDDVARLVYNQSNNLSDNARERAEFLVETAEIRLGKSAAARDNRDYAEAKRLADLSQAYSKRAEALYANATTPGGGGSSSSGVAESTSPSIPGGGTGTVPDSTADVTYAESSQAIDDAYSVYQDVAGTLYGQSNNLSDDVRERAEFILVTAETRLGEANTANQAQDFAEAKRLADLGRAYSKRAASVIGADELAY